MALELPLLMNDLSREYFSIKEEIDEAIKECIDTTSFIGGPQVSLFETEFAKAVSKDFCISCGNGTDALYIALKSFDLDINDEVIVPALTWISSSETITQAGAKPVFADIEEGSWVITLDSIKKVLSSKTKGIVVVNLYGKLANISQIASFAKEHNLFVIEDCAQSHLAKNSKLKHYSESDISTYSFFPGKNLGAYGDAGAITTNDSEIANFCRLYARHGSLKKGNHIIEGINSRMDTIQASILAVKLKYLLKNTEKRIQNAILYHKHLSVIKQINIPMLSSGLSHVYHLYVINTDERDSLKKYLAEHSIFTNINYPIALPDQKCYKSNLIQASKDFRVSRYLARTCLSLPMHPFLLEDEIKYVAHKIQSFFEK